MKLFLFLLFVIPTCQRETIAPRYDIIGWGGQSNVSGLATLELQDYGSGAWLWNNSGWAVADGALDRYSNAYPQPNNNIGLSMVNSFGKQLAQAQARPLIGLVVNARPGSLIEAWRDSLFMKLLVRLKDAEDLNTGSQVKAICFQQGEGNYQNPWVWIPAVRILKAKADSVFGRDIPMIFGGIRSDLASLKPINDTIKHVVTIPNCYYVSSDGLTTFDTWHFDSESQRIFGLRFAAVYSQNR